MASKGKLISKLENCIEQVAEEWREGSDDYFWWEADLRNRLQSLLWACCEMWDAPHLVGKARKVSLIHAEAPAAVNKRLYYYDLALYEPGIAWKIVREDLIPKNYPGNAKERPVLAAIEVALAYCPPNSKLPSPLSSKGKKDIEDAFNRLNSNINIGLLDHGYVLIAVTTYTGDKENYCNPKLLQDAQQWIKGLCAGAPPNKIKVYWVSDHPYDSPIWIP